MTDNPQDNLEAAQSEPAARPASSTPVADGTDWEKSYKGLQSSYQKLKAATDTTVAELQRQLGESQSTIETQKLEIASLNEKLASEGQRAEAVTKERDAIKQEAEATKANLTRAKLVMDKYPQLAGFEARGLLPTAESEEALTAVLEEFANVMNAKASSELQQRLSGAVPPQPPGTPQDTETEDFLWRKMSETANTPEFLEWQRKFDALMERKNT